MLKKILVFLVLIFGMSVFAADNFLNTVVVEEHDGYPYIVLRADAVSKIKKKADGNDRLILTLKNLKAAQDVNTIYKNVLGIDGLIIQKDGNDLQLFIEAKDISRANIVFETPNSAPITVSDDTTDGKFALSIISAIVLFLIIASAKNINNDEPVQKDITEIIKEREKALYKNFQKEVATLPSMNYKLKSYRKHVLKGETIRSYESRLSKI